MILKIIMLLNSLLGNSPDLALASKGLGHPKHQVREICTRYFEINGSRGLERVRGLCKDKDAEVAARSDRIVRTFASRIRPSVKKELPCLDSLPIDYPRRVDLLRKYYWEYQPWEEEPCILSIVMWCQFDEEPIRHSTGEFVVQLVKDGTPNSSIVALLDDMWAFEDCWVLWGGRMSTPDFTRHKEIKK